MSNNVGIISHEPMHVSSDCQPRSHLILLCIIAVALLLRLVTVLYIWQGDPAKMSSNDTPSYVEPALSLLERGALMEKMNSNTPMYVRTPGYPVFIAAIFSAFGPSFLWIAMVQVLIGSATVGLCYLIGLQFWKKRIALTGAALLAIEPLHIVSSAKILTECLHALVLTAFSLISVHLLTRKESSLFLWFVAGFLVALSTYVRPVTYYFIILFLPFLLWRVKKQPRTVRSLLFPLLAFLFPVLILVGGWTVRNVKVVNSWRFSGIEAINIYFYRASGVVAEKEHRRADEARDQFRQEFGEPPDQKQGVYYDRMLGMGLSILRKHPVEFALITIKGFISEVFGFRSPLFYFFNIPQKTPFLIIAQSMVLAFYGFALTGVLYSYRHCRARSAHLLCLAIIAYILVVSAGPEANPRFRTPLMPILSAYAAAGLWESVLLLRSRLRPFSSRSS